MKILNRLYKKYKHNSQIIKHKIVFVCIAIFSIYGVSIVDVSQNINQRRVNGMNFENYVGVVTDHEPPEITLSKIDFEIDEIIETVVISNEPIQINNTDFKIGLIGIDSDMNHSYYLKYEKDLNFHSKKVVFFDSSNNKTEKYLFFDLDSWQYPEIKKANECIYSKNKDILSIPIDKYHCISDNLVNENDLVLFEYNEGIFQIHNEAYASFINLIKNSESANISLEINSAYRSIDDQKSLREKYELYYGIIQADRLSALPEKSEHHLGTAIDFGSKEVDTIPRTSFEDTKAYEWLKNNAWKYGFVESYPEGKEARTGYRFEPWHWRYVGKEHAESFRQIDDITLNEYLLIIEENI